MCAARHCQAPLGVCMGAASYVAVERGWLSCLQMVPVMVSHYHFPLLAELSVNINKLQEQKWLRAFTPTLFNCSLPTPLHFLIMEGSLSLLVFIG